MIKQLLFLALCCGCFASHANILQESSSSSSFGEMGEGPHQGEHHHHRPGQHQGFNPQQENGFNGQQGNRMGHQPKNGFANQQGNEFGSGQAKGNSNDSGAANTTIINSGKFWGYSTGSDSVNNSNAGQTEK